MPTVICEYLTVRKGVCPCPKRDLLALGTVLNEGGGKHLIPAVCRSTAGTCVWVPFASGSFRGFDPILKSLLLVDS